MCKHCLKNDQFACNFGQIIPVDKILKTFEKPFTPFSATKNGMQ